MAYRFAAGVEKSEYESFLAEYGHYSLMQDPAWAGVKSGWAHDFVLLYQEDKAVAGALILIRRLLPGFTILYAPRGFLLDYADRELVRVFTESIKQYAKKKGAYLVRIDPEIVLSSLHMGNKTEFAKGKEEMDNLMAEGFRHKGFAKDFQSYTQPRFYADIYLQKEDGTPMTDEELSKSISKQARKDSAHYDEKYGIFVEKTSGKEAIKEFADLVRHTEQRQHVLLRDGEYFQRIADFYGDKCELYFARMDLDAFEKKLAEREDEEKRARDEALLALYRKEYGNVITMCASLTIRTSDTSYAMYAGFNNEVFPQYSATTILRTEIMRHCRNAGLKAFSLMGINGELKDSLSKFKLKFNPRIVEYAGEFELAVSPLRYAVMDKLFPLLKRIYIRLTLLLKLGKEK